MADRNVPHQAFNFLVEMPTGRDAESIQGGFQEVSGLSTELTIAEYRTGNSKVNHVSKVPGIFKTGDVTFKRGVFDSQDLWDWIALARREGPVAKREVKVTLRNETGEAVQSWILRGAVPMKYTGPSLNAKGGQDVAVEELVISAELIDFQPGA